MSKIFHSTLLSAICIACVLSCNNVQQDKRPDDGQTSAESAKWKMGVALYSFHKHSLEKALSLAQSSGTRYVEGFSFYELGPAFSDSTMGTLNNDGSSRLMKMLDEKGLEMSSMYVGGANDLTAWRNFFELAKKLKVSYLVCEPERRHWDLLDSLAGIYNIKVAIHEHAKGESYYWHPDSVVAAMKGHANIGACADLGHWARSGLNPVDCLKKLDGKIIGVHLKDVAESGNLHAKNVNPGEGIIDFSGVVNELKRQNFNGYIHVECEHNLDNNLEDVKKAVTYLNELGGDN